MKWIGWVIGAACWTSIGLCSLSLEAKALDEELTAVRHLPLSPARLGSEARLLHFLAEETPDQRGREQLHLEGLELARLALRTDPSEPSALLWWAAHRGSQASPLQPWEAVQIASEVEGALLRLLQVDSAYEHGAADRALGYLYCVAPPLISVGSMSKAERHLRAALARAPDYPGNQLFYAQFQLKRRDCHAAAEYARRLLLSPELAKYPLEERRWRSEARRVLAKADEVCRPKYGGSHD